MGGLQDPATIGVTEHRHEDFTLATQDDDKAFGYAVPAPGRVVLRSGV
ncbi:hypothetical protein EDD29_4731 [Actinocorallia herbida]|uniref:Uncharacterized protein n=1 Tax=Actinocorallia herbida TaxID=58109 RepID=A0A3N1D0U6_9ACTN|nr:hypothetical protein EDD29_4731 [Actinocorallia herbida]